MMVQRIRMSVAAAVAVFALLAAACANGYSSGAAAGTGSGATADSGSTATSGGGGGNGAGAAGGGGSRYGYGGGGGGSGNGSGQGSGDVRIALTADNFLFAPTDVRATSGSQIHIENANAGTPHSFTVEGTSIDLTLEPGTVEDLKVDLDPGTYPFHCRFHASMTGTLTVT